MMNVPVSNAKVLLYPFRAKSKCVCNRIACAWRKLVHYPQEVIHISLLFMFPA